MRSGCTPETALTNRDTNRIVRPLEWGEDYAPIGMTGVEEGAAFGTQMSCNPLVYRNRFVVIGVCRARMGRSQRKVANGS
jgi:hypothetical protein